MYNRKHRHTTCISLHSVRVQGYRWNGSRGQERNSPTSRWSVSGQYVWIALWVFNSVRVTLAITGRSSLFITINYRISGFLFLTDSGVDLPAGNFCQPDGERFVFLLNQTPYVHQQDLPISMLNESWKSCFAGSEDLMSTQMCFWDVGLALV